MNIKPRIYKKTLFIGKKRIFKFTKEYTFKFLHKAIWILLLLILIVTMVFGGVALLLGSEVQPTQQIQIVE